MNAKPDKLGRIKSEIPLLKGKLAALQSKSSVLQQKLRTLEKQKQEIENEQILAIVRHGNISDAELGARIRSIRDGNHIKPKDQVTTKMEETHYENKTDE
jgi:hypothetical protein